MHLRCAALTIRNTVIQSTGAVIAEATTEFAARAHTQSRASPIAGREHTGQKEQEG